MRQATVFLLALVLAMLSAPLATAWWCQGHMLVAEIAMQIVSPSLATKIQTIVTNFDSMGPWPKSPDAVQLACWADDIKGNLHAMNGWHYIDTPYNPDNIVIDGNPVGTENIANQINNMYGSFRNSPNAWEETFALAWLIHLIGDIHQPMHCVSLYNDKFPDGDVGGNKFDIYVRDGNNLKQSNLHAYWDSICGLNNPDFSRPLNSSNAKSLTQTAIDMMMAYNTTLSSHEKHIYDPKVMANESYTVAIDYAYADLKPGATISDDYHAACEEVAQKRIVLAGYRLANQLEYLIKP